MVIQEVKSISSVAKYDVGLVDGEFAAVVAVVVTQLPYSADILAYFSHKQLASQCCPHKLRPSRWPLNAANW